MGAPEACRNIGKAIPPSTASLMKRLLDAALVGFNRTAEEMGKLLV